MKTTPVTLLVFLSLITGTVADTFVVTNSSDPSDCGNAWAIARNVCTTTTASAG